MMYSISCVQNHILIHMIHPRTCMSRSLSGVRSQVEVQAALQAEGGRAYGDYEDHLVLVGVCGIKVRLRLQLYGYFIYVYIYD